MAVGLEGLDGELSTATELPAGDEAAAAATTSCVSDADAAAVGIFVVRRRIRFPDFSFSIRTQFPTLSDRQQAEGIVRSQSVNLEGVQCKHIELTVSYETNATVSLRLELTSCHKVIYLHFTLFILVQTLPRYWPFL